MTFACTPTQTEWVETGFRAHAHKLRMTSRQQQRESKELVDSILAKLKVCVCVCVCVCDI